MERLHLGEHPLADVSVDRLASDEVDGAAAGGCELGLKTIETEAQAGIRLRT